MSFSQMWDNAIIRNHVTCLKYRWFVLLNNNDLGYYNKYHPIYPHAHYRDRWIHGTPYVSSKQSLNVLSVLENFFSRKRIYRWLCFSHGAILISIEYTPRITLTIRPFLCSMMTSSNWKHFPHYWPFVRGIHRWPVNSRTKASHAELWCFLWSVPELTVE